MSKHLLTKWYNGHMLYRNLPDPPQIWHVSGLTNRGGTVIPSNTSGVNGDIISLSYELNPECQFYAYNVIGAELTGNRFAFNNSDVTASLSYYDRLAMTGKFCDKIVPLQGNETHNESKFYITTDGIERINNTVGYFPKACTSYGGDPERPTYNDSEAHHTVEFFNFSTGSNRQVILSASITATFYNPSGQWAVGDHTVTSWPGRGYIALYGDKITGTNPVKIASKTINMPGVGSYTAVLDASAYIYTGSYNIEGSINYMLSANSDLYAVDITPVATTGIWKIINRTV